MLSSIKKITLLTFILLFTINLGTTLYYHNDFIVSAAAPTTTTNATTGTSYANTTLHGFLSNDGGENCSVWFEWGETVSYGNTEYPYSLDFTKIMIDSSVNQIYDTFTIDLDEDGDLDIVASVKGDKDVVWYDNDGSMSFTKTSIDSSCNSYDVHVIDLDEDGDYDVISSDLDGHVYWYDNDGSESFTKKTVANEKSYGIYPFDYDDDGDIDIIRSNDDFSEIVVSSNNGAEVFGSYELCDYTSYPSFYDRSRRMDVGDIDGDGDIDIVCTDVVFSPFYRAAIIWLENDGSISGWDRHEVYGFSTYLTNVEFVECVDLDEDGDVDVLATDTAYYDDVYFFENDGSGVFSKNTVDSYLSGAMGVCSGDIDDDGDLDVVASGNSGDDVKYYLNDGSETFSERTIDSSLNGAYRVECIDLDLDGDLDVVASGDAAFDLVWYENTLKKGNGTEFNYSLTGLSPSTTYHYRSVANNSDGESYGSDKTFNTSNSIASNTTTSITSTTADLQSYLYYSDSTGDYGFWYNTSPVSPSNPGTNTTVGSNPSSHTSFSKSIASLQRGQYYYARSWHNSDNYFVNSTNETHFLTKPGTVTNPTVTSFNATNITLSWTEGEHAVTNSSTIIRYDTSGYPTSITDGLGGTNTTSTTYKFTGLSGDTTYYFSFWTYINASGSPLLHQYSQFAAYSTQETSGGNFNLTIRYENTTHQRVNLTKGLQHELIIHYENKTEYIYFDDAGEVDTTNSTSTINPSFTVEENGTISFLTLATIRMLEFHWNWTEDVDTSILQRYDTTDVSSDVADIWLSLTNSPLTEYNIDVEIYNSTIYGGWILVPSSKWTYHSNNDTIQIDNSFIDDNVTIARITYYYQSTTPYRCRRVIVPQNQSHDDIYILTDKKIYGVTTSSSESMLDTLVDYIYNIQDYDGSYFNPNNNPYLLIYTIDESGNTRIIHSEFFDTAMQIHPQLLFHKLYRVGVRSDIDSNDFIAFAPTDEDTSPTINLPYQESEYYTFSDLINFSYGWTATSIFFNYSDTTYSTTNASFMSYYLINKTYIPESLEYTETDNYNFTFTTGEGLNHSSSYLIYISTTINTLDDASSSNDMYTGQYNIILTVYNTSHNLTRTSETDIEKKFTDLFGDSPVYSWENENRYVPWTYLIMFFLCFYAGVTFSKNNGFIGMVAAGLIMLIFPVFVAGLSTLFGATYTYVEITVSVVGGILVAVGIVGILGGVELR